MSTETSTLPTLPPAPARWPIQSGEKYYEHVTGPYSGREWVVFNTGKIVSQQSVLDPSTHGRHDVPGDCFGGYLPARPGKSVDRELHFSVYLDHAGNRLPGLPAVGNASLWIDMTIHGDWPAFYAQLAEADQRVAQWEQHGYPARLGAHVGPEPPVVVDGTESAVLAPEPPYTPVERALLAQGLHATDLGYPDPEASEWLGRDAL